MSAHFYREHGGGEGKDSHASRMGLTLCFGMQRREDQCLLIAQVTYARARDWTAKAWKLEICKKERLSIERICWMPNMPSAFRLYTGDEWVKCAWLTSLFSSTVHFTYEKKSCQVRENAREGWKELHYNSVNSALFFSIFFRTPHFACLHNIAKSYGAWWKFARFMLNENATTVVEEARKSHFVFLIAKSKKRPLKDLMNEKERLQALKSWEKEKFSTPPAAIEWRMKKEGRTILK